MKRSVLARLRFRLIGWRLVTLVLALAASLALAALAAVLADAALNLSDLARVLATIALAALGCAGIALVCLRCRALTELRIARQFQQSRPDLGSRLSNAIELEGYSSNSPVTEALRGEVFQLAERAGDSLRVLPIARPWLSRALALLFIAVVAWIIAAFFAGDVVRAVLPRYLDPHGDHPPFSRLRIEARPGPAQVLYGSQLEVRASAAGRPVDKLWLVAKTGTNLTRTMMFLAPDRTYFQTLVNLREPTEYYITDGSARTRRFPIHIRYTPQITLLELTLSFPDYTGKAPRTQKLGEEPISVPAGTRITARVTSNRPLSGGELVRVPLLGGAAKAVKLARAETSEAPENTVLGEFTVEESEQFTVSVMDVNGLKSAETKTGRATILPDRRPSLHVMEPGRDAIATPAIRVPVKVQASDDYGVSRVVWLRGHNRSLERAFDMKLTLKNGPQSVESAGAFDLGKLGVRAGDIIEYYFEAADNYPKGPNLALSRIYRLEVITPEQYEQILRSAAARKALFEPYLKLGAWLGRLAERARRLDNDAQTGKQVEQQAKELAEELQKYHAELAKVRDQVLFFDVEQAFRENLVTQDVRISEHLKSAPWNPKQLSELAKQLEQLAQSEEREVSGPSRRIASVAAVLAKADEFVRLARAQATVAQMLRRFADKSGDLSRMEQIELQELRQHEQRIQDDLRKLLAGLPDQLAKVPAAAEFDAVRKSVKEFMDAVQEAGIEPDLKDALKSLAELDAATGWSHAQSAAEKMDKLISKCQSMPKDGEACLRFQPSMQKSLGNTLQQILEAMGSGHGGQGDNGYTLLNSEVGLYGPNVELAGAPGGDGGQDSTSGAGTGRPPIASDAPDPDPTRPAATGRVRLQPDARFPLRYRDLVGDYFRAIAETEANATGN